MREGQRKVGQAAEKMDAGKGMMCRVVQSEIYKIHTALMSYYISLSCSEILDRSGGFFVFHALWFVFFLFRFCVAKPVKYLPTFKNNLRFL